MKCSWGDFRLHRSNQFEDEICQTDQKQTFTVSLAKVNVLWGVRLKCKPAILKKSCSLQGTGWQIRCAQVTVFCCKLWSYEPLFLFCHLFSNQGRCILFDVNSQEVLQQCWHQQEGFHWFGAQQFRCWLQQKPSAQVHSASIENTVSRDIMCVPAGSDAAQAHLSQFHLPLHPKADAAS